MTMQSGFAENLTIIKSGARTVLYSESPFSIGNNRYLQLKLSGSGIIHFYGENRHSSIRFDTGAEAQDIFFYENLIGFSPDEVVLEGGGSFDLFSARTAEPPANEPLPADIGHIIFSDFPDDEVWRIYSWNLDPEVLIFDTADYETQSRFFKRLAFFVEKPGYVGRLVPDEELEGKHGWNAHDYKPDDLAAFFTLARQENFPLHDEENELREILLDRQIITEKDGRFEEGAGAVLSVSRQTEASWRYRFLTHECLHGLFFTNKDYQSEMFAAFKELAPEEIDFWKHLLDYRHYDVSNEYLLVNEFMAYSLQQPEEEIDEYFKGFLYRRMVAARPYESGFIDTFEQNFGNSFRTTVSNLEKILYNHTGRIAGHLANIYPAELKRSFFDLFPSL